MSNVNQLAMLALIDQFRNIEKKVLEAEQLAKPKFEKKNQLLPRERLALLLDRGSPFLELSSLAGYLMHDDKTGEGAGGGNIIGIGFVSGIRCLIICNNSAVKGGTISPMGLKKSLRAQQIAMENKLPVVSLIESGGANLFYQSEVFVEGGQYFANQARLSAMGIPQFCIVHGNSTAGGAYMPGLCDYVIMVKNNAKVFLAGPPLLKAATGEIATEEALGGSLMHATEAGTAEYLAENDQDAIRILRELLSKMPFKHLGTDHSLKSVLPHYKADELLDIVPVDSKKPYDSREVIARLVDASDFLEFKALYDQQTICGHAELEGHPCGLIANNGPITAKGAVKAAQFIQLCCQTQLPIIYLQNTTGYMVGVEAEQSGIIKHGSKMLQAVANCTVPQITLVIGGSYGAGNYGMCGRGLGPRFIFSWPNSKTAVMGAEQAAEVMSIVTRAKYEKSGQAVDEEKLLLEKQKIIEKMQQESTALFATARLWDDGIIDPRDSRSILGMILSICVDASTRQLHPNTFGVARM